MLDPDRLAAEELERRAVLCAEAGADALLVGTSLMLSSKYAAFFERIKHQVDIPVISFPGGASQVTSTADAHATSKSLSSSKFWAKALPERSF